MDDMDYLKSRFVVMAAARACNGWYWSSVLVVLFTVTARAQTQRPVAAPPAIFQQSADDLELNGNLNVNNISGEIVDRRGHPISGVVVSLVFMWNSGSATVANVRTDRRGAFQFLGLRYGIYAITLSSPENRYPTLVEVTSRELSRSQKTAWLPLTLSPGAVITGRVLDKRTGAPWVGIQVEADPDGTLGVRQEFTAETKTDATGRYRLRVPAGKFNISPPTPGVVQHHIAREGDVIHLNLYGNLPPVVSLLDDRRKPVTGASVQLYSREDKRYPGELLTFGTDGEGKINPRYLHSGVLRARRGDLYGEWALRWVSATGHMYVTMAEGTEDCTKSSIALPMMATSPPASISGDVVDEAGKPIANAVVELTGLEASSLDKVDEFTLNTDRVGHFHGVLSPGKYYSLHIHAEGFQDAKVYSDYSFQAQRNEDRRVGKVVLAPWVHQPAPNEAVNAVTGKRFAVTSVGRWPNARRNWGEWWRR